MDNWNEKDWALVVAAGFFFFMWMIEKAEKLMHRQDAIFCKKMWYKSNGWDEIDKRQT